MRPPRVVVALLLVALLASACTSDAEVTAEPPDPTPAPTTAAAPTVSPTEAPAPTAAPTASPTSVPESTPVPTVDATPVPSSTPLATSLPTLPGGEWDLFVPARGEIVAVVGVAFDDSLEVHAAPGENSETIANFAPLEDAIVSAGEGRSLPSSIWWRVTMSDIDGWVGSRFMTRLGVVVDVTSQVVDSLGSLPAAETMVDLAMIVANDRASEDPPSNIVISRAPTVGDLGEIIIDVVGFPDDAVQGERLHIFGQPLESGEGFSLKAVEATIMCRRGVSVEGLCI